jgi:hypothetical protein
VRDFRVSRHEMALLSLSAYGTMIWRGQRGAIAEGEFEIEFLDPGVQACALTFG